MCGAVANTFYGFRVSYSNADFMALFTVIVSALVPGGGLVPLVNLTETRGVHQKFNFRVLSIPTEGLVFYGCNEWARRARPPGGRGGTSGIFRQYGSGA